MTVNDDLLCGIFNLLRPVFPSNRNQPIDL